MNATRDTQEKALIVGLGKTGLSIARFLSARAHVFIGFDTRSKADFSEAALAGLSATDTYFEELPEALDSSIDRVYLSPGVSRSHSVVKRFILRGVPVIGDIALFLEHCDKPVIGITGSNGKSTVTTLVGEVLKAAGMRTVIAGNIGMPALDLLDLAEVDAVVLELSSFQLESTPEPNLAVACFLNLSEDHMDRYSSMSEYAAAKRNIYQGAEHCVFNLDDTETYLAEKNTTAATGFSMGFDAKRSGVWSYDSKKQALYHADEQVLHRDQIKLCGKHNIANALAAFAITGAFGVDHKHCIDVLQKFSGLAHRCEFVDKRASRTFINDSKGTNEGASIAALEGLFDEFKGIVLIAGGDGKGADFKNLGDAIAQFVRVTVLIGKNAAKIASQIGNRVLVFEAVSMEQAVQTAFEHSREGEAILLSPACASFDMFENFEHRGREFVRCVEALEVNDACA